MQFFFSEASMLVTEAVDWIHHINKHETSYNARFKIDKDFRAKVLGAINLGTTII